MRKLILILISIGFLSVQAMAADRTLIYGGRVLAVPGSPPLKDHTIIVRGQTIEGVAQGFIRPEKTDRVIDLKAAFVLPGMIDAHVHLTGQLGPKSKLERTENEDTYSVLKAQEYGMRTLRAGFTTVRDIGGKPEIVFALRKAINEGVVQGPRILAAGHIISPTGGHGQTYGYREDVNALFASSGICNGPEDCRRAVRLQVQKGADFIKLVATGGVLSDIKAGLDKQFTDEEFKATVETAHGLGRKVAAHAHGTDGLNAALRAGVDSIEHGTYLNDESIRLFRRSGAVHVPTVIAGVTVANFAKTMDFMSAAQKEKSLQVGPEIIGALKRSHAAGVTIAFGTDCGVCAHGSNAKEFTYMVEAGMTPMAAIKAATINGAALLGLSDEIGTIEKGKAADIVAVAADPLKDVKALEAMTFVMRKGTAVPLR